MALNEKTKNDTLRIRDCGLADYRDALRQQLLLCNHRQKGQIPDTVLIIEHTPVITLGARRSANILLADKETLAQKGIEVTEVRRGGGTTAHNPGQIVFYPIIALRQRKLTINEYIRLLEEIGIQLLEQAGLRSKRKKGFPGLWVGEKKIASIGVRVSKGVTYHGMAINISNDLSIFDLFVPCGLEGVEMTSVLKETGKEYPMEKIKQDLTDLLKSHFPDPPRTQAASRRSGKLPPWLKRPLGAGENYTRTNRVLKSLGIETICTNANCPNQGQCWSRGTATVLILGNICTRNCRFCSVPKGKPLPPDPAEPIRIGKMAKELNLKYLVITSVDRDDLPDGGAAHFADCVNAARKLCPDLKFEILTPDFRACQSEAIEALAKALPFVFAHNIETVPSLYQTARPGANYRQSMNLLKRAKQKFPNTITKSSIMLGLGETEDQVIDILKDLRAVKCDRVTIGQYLKPSKTSLDVVEYVTPEKFEWWKQKAVELGFGWVMSSPFTRSSYMAEQQSTI